MCRFDEGSRGDNDVNFFAILENAIRSDDLICVCIFYSIWRIEYRPFEDWRVLYGRNYIEGKYKICREIFSCGSLILGGFNNKTGLFLYLCMVVF